MPLLARKTTILAKIEASYGVDPTPTGAANAILVRNVNLSPQEATLADRNLIRSYLGNSEQIPAALFAKLDFEVEMAASGTAGTAPAYGPLLRACGVSETLVAVTSATYAPISTAFESVTIYDNIDGVLHKMLGARGDVTAEWPLHGIPVWKFSFTGIYVTVADGAAPTPTYTSFQKPLTVNNANTTPFTLHGISAVMSAMTLNFGNEVKYRNLVGGSEAVLITDRQVSGQITIEANTVAVKDWWTTIKNATLGAIALTHGTAAGNKIALTSSGVQLNAPRYVDMDGVQMLQMGMLFVPVSGNDEFSIVMT